MALNNRQLSITSVIALPCNAPDATNLIANIETLHSYVSLARVLITTLTPPLVYRYRIDALDGRIWRQDIFFTSDDDGDPRMTFTVADGWKLSEFAAQRELRSHIVRILRKYQVSTIDYSLPSP